MYINSRTQFHLSLSVTFGDMESSICYWFNITGPPEMGFGGFLVSSGFLGIFWLNLTKSGFLRHCSFSPHSWLVTFYYQFTDDTKFHGTETAVVMIFI